MNPIQSMPLIPSFVQVFYNGTTLLSGAHKIIGATKHVTNAFFYGIFITTNRKSWNYEKELYVNNLSLRIYLVVIAWRYSKFKLYMKRTNKDS
jgi:hypothetical protein